MPKDRPPVPPDHKDVRLLETELIGAHYGRHLRYVLKFRRFDGTWSAAVSREVFDSGPAVIVLPYDPAADKVVLIRQFRVGPWFQGEDPWMLEIVAGRIDKAATAEEIAHQETDEEAGLKLTALERLPSFYTSPGIFAERLDAFCGRIEVPDRPGVFGLDAEHEDIRAEIFEADEAIRLAQSGAITSGPTLICLHWLALNRSALRDKWCS